MRFVTACMVNASIIILQAQVLLDCRNGSGLRKQLKAPRAETRMQTGDIRHLKKPLKSLQKICLYSILSVAVSTRCDTNNEELDTNLIIDHCSEQSLCRWTITLVSVKITTPKNTFYLMSVRHVCWKKLEGRGAINW